MPTELHQTTWCADETIHIIETHRDGPWLASVNIYDPHPPFNPPLSYRCRYNPQDLPGPSYQQSDLTQQEQLSAVDFASRARPPDDLDMQSPVLPLSPGIGGEWIAAEAPIDSPPFTEARDANTLKAAYYAMIEQIDDQVQRIIDTVEDSGQRNQTLIIFMSDHGELLGDHGIPAKAPFLLDCMLHVPCLVRIPGQDSGDRNALAESIDLFPTLCGLAGIDTPDCVQGQDLAPVLAGGEEFRELIFAEAVDKRCIRTKDWKYIHYPTKPYGELYDLREDPHELKNLFSERPEKVREMRDRFYACMDATEDFRNPKYQRFTGTDPKTGGDLTHYLTW